MHSTWTKVKYKKDMKKKCMPLIVRYYFQRTMNQYNYQIDLNYKQTYIHILHSYIHILHSYIHILHNYIHILHSYIHINKPMIQQIWQKSIIAQIYIDQNDIADDMLPLPLFIQLYWNHYIGTYYGQIQSFYASYAVYPFSKDQFYLSLDSQGLRLDGSEIIGHLVTAYNEGEQRPIKLTCHFRNKYPLPNIQTRKFFKNNLKASTSIRNRKFGASVLTVQMSIQNVDRMFQSFLRNDIKSYLGSDNFQTQDLGYAFVISKTQKIPVRIMSNQFTLERGALKTKSLGLFIAEIFGQLLTQQSVDIDNQQNQVTQGGNQAQPTNLGENAQNKNVTFMQNNAQKTVMTQIKNQRQRNVRYNYLFQKYNLYLHGIRLTRGQYSLGFYERFCHPDGYLYIFLKGAE